MEDIRHYLTKNTVELYLLTKNKGKFRWKNRKDNSQFGNGFATATTPFTEEAYMEWQIGYDSEVNHSTKTTILSHLEFVGANGKRKNPYELSEILFLMKEVGLITRDEIKDLHDDIERRQFSFDDQFDIQTNEKETVRISDFTFHQQDIVLPTFSDYKTNRGLSIEISIKQQQYASGVQPMVYFAIPIQCFENHKDIIGKTSKEMEEAKLVINQDNKKVILNMFKYFGICSSRHKHDVLSILKLLF
ncbi:MAG TPA: R.Pab1 family restriction endonuclease [Bacilli bacterium]|nr:R.Pab1 family restriction endonuclease [Bacilli bacterium]